MSFDLQQLRNMYFVMRHGKSLANNEEVINSNPEKGVNGYGLTEEGKEQAKKNAEHAQQEGMLDENTVVFSSDFARARETAEIVSEVLGCEAPLFTPKLRERNFGDFEGTSNSNYEKVWEVDAERVSHEGSGIEEVSDVRERVLTLMGDLEETNDGKNILLVSHGDTLQILLTVFASREPYEHRSLPHLQTAEIRKCN
jgi:broad specificity phosphatase PhoE